MNAKTNHWTRLALVKPDSAAKDGLYSAGGKKRILFVDDEPTMLELYRVMFEPVKNHWEIVTCASAAEALALFEQAAFDVVVSDMRMPVMNGLELLDQIKRKYPQTARLILSGYAEHEQAARAMGTVHQFLLKPCDMLTLLSTVTRVCDLDVFLHNDLLRVLASQMSTIPSVPSVYFRLLRELQSPDANMENIGELVLQDPSLSAKLLQLVNSAFFGISRKVSHPTEAVNLLGVNTLRSLALCAHTFSCFEQSKIESLCLKNLWSHSYATGQIAQNVARMARAGIKVMEESLIGGLLHDLGVMMFAYNFPEQYKEVVALMKNKQITRWQAESDVFGATHADIGAYLLGLWGLPVGIVEAVALHHHPSSAIQREFSPLAAVHIANTFEHRQSNSPESPLIVDQMDMQYLEEVGIGNFVPDWQMELTMPPMPQAM
jgi:HD-like signal output (HDOD) protein